METGAGHALRPQAKVQAIDFYFDFISPFGYFASLRIDALGAQYGRAVNWHAILIGVSVMKVMGLPPVVSLPLKGAYIVRDAQRYARRHGLTVRRDFAAAPSDPLPAGRAFAWAREARPRQARALAAGLFEQYWAGNRDIGDAAVVEQALAAAGIAVADYREAQARGLPKELLKRDVDASLQRGVFGSPFFLVGDEPFFGVEKMELLEDWLRQGGW